VTGYLLDTSAFWQGRINGVAKQRLEELSNVDALSLCTPAILEMLVGARNGDEWRAMVAVFDAIPRVELSDQRRAIELHGELARRGQHRTPVIDVLVAATAAEHDLTILHYDRDFERLCRATGGRQEWVVPAGSGH
jgi:predicted nucleic acid-binding protein